MKASEPGIGLRASSLFTTEFSMIDVFKFPVNSKDGDESSAFHIISDECWRLKLQFALSMYQVGRSF
jgi:hypothetical protein